MSKIKEDILEHLFYDEYIQEQLQNEEMKAAVKRLDDYVMNLELDPEVISELYKMIIENQLTFFMLGYDLENLMARKQPVDNIWEQSYNIITAK